MHAAPILTYNSLHKSCLPLLQGNIPFLWEASDIINEISADLGFVHNKFNLVEVRSTPWVCGVVVIRDMR